MSIDKKLLELIDLQAAACYTNFTESQVHSIITIRNLCAPEVSADISSVIIKNAETVHSKDAQRKE